MQKQTQFAQLQAVAKTIVSDLKKFEANTNWVKYGDKPCEMSKMEIEEGMATRSSAIVNFSFAEVIEFLEGEGTLKKVNPKCIEDKTLYAKDTLKVKYLRYSAPWPVSHRDFCTVTYKQYEGENKLYMGSKSCGYPCPEVSKVVRGNILIGGYIIEAIDKNTTRVTYIASVDIKGSIPDMVKNELSKKEGEVASKVETAMIAQNKK